MEKQTPAATGGRRTVGVYQGYVGSILYTSAGAYVNPRRRP